MAEAIKTELKELVQGLFQQEGRLREVVQKLVQASLETELERHLKAGGTSGQRSERDAETVINGVSGRRGLGNWSSGCRKLERVDSGRHCLEDISDTKRR
jgi:hypothetical protein